GLPPLSGNRRSALHLLGSRLPRSARSNRALAAGAKSTARSNGTPCTWLRDAGGGRNGPSAACGTGARLGGARRGGTRLGSDRFAAFRLGTARPRAGRLCGWACFLAAALRRGAAFLPVAALRFAAAFFLTADFRFATRFLAVAFFRFRAMAPL